jgi:hypothetical protein
VLMNYIFLKFFACHRKNSKVYSSIFISVALQPKSGLGSLTVQVFRWHTNRHIYQARLLWTSDQLVTDAENYITQIYETNTLDLSGIRIHDPSNQAAVEPRFIPHSYLNRPLQYLQ